MQIEIEEQLIKRIENLHPDYELARYSDKTAHVRLLTAYVNETLTTAVLEEERLADQEREMRWYESDEGKI